MEALAHLSADIDPPSWIGLHSAAETAAAQMISCENGLLDLSARILHDPTPALFNVVAVPFDYQPNPDPPTEWLKLLASVWPDDSASIMLLQEYIGYLLSGRTDMQKMLLLLGPTRSGKGTVARMLNQLIGRGHVAGPTLASLGTNFGLSPLLGKPLAVISDARLGNMPSPHRRRAPALDYRRGLAHRGSQVPSAVVGQVADEVRRPDQRTAEVPG